MRDAIVVLCALVLGATAMPLAAGVDTPLVELRSLSVNPSAFDVNYASFPFTKTYHSAMAYDDTAVMNVNAPVYLPEEATVVSLRASVYDASTAESITVKLFAHTPGSLSVTTMASATSSGSPGYTTLTDSTIVDADVDNFARSYAVQGYWNPPPVADQIMLQEVMIWYEVPVEVP